MCHLLLNSTLCFESGSLAERGWGEGSLKHLTSELSPKPSPAQFLFLKCINARLLGAALGCHAGGEGERKRKREKRTQREKEEREEKRHKRGE